MVPFPPPSFSRPSFLSRGVRLLVHPFARLARGVRPVVAPRWIALGIVAVLAVFAGSDALDSSRASATSVLQIGSSAQGRQLEISCFNSGSTEGDRVALIVGAIHTGNEAVTYELALGLISDFAQGRLETPDNVTVCVLPNLNPDGLALGLHTNANHVDLNRNWPSEDWTAQAWHPETGTVSAGHAPLSEPETRALHEFLEMVRPSAVFVLHCCGALVEANREPAAVFMAHRYARAAGFEYVDKWDYYDISGEFIDSMDELAVPAMDIELVSPNDTGIETHRAGFRAVLDYLSEH